MSAKSSRMRKIMSAHAHSQPSIYVIAGPNGAGKTTFANIVLPNFLHVKDFVNADTLARGLSAFAPESVKIEAGRLMLKRLGELTAENATFAFESTLASRSFHSFLRRQQASGYEIKLFYVWVADPAISVMRVANRVTQGGHHVPETDVRRRYQRSVSNMLSLYLPLADYAEIYHNTDDGYVKIATKSESDIKIIEEPTWKSITSIT